jgi:prepilin-type processing-associated H-X9-DG protein
LNDNVGVVGGPKPFQGTVVADGRTWTVGQALQAKLFKVQKPSDVMLYADCGTRPARQAQFPLDMNDALYYTTNYMIYASPVPKPEHMGRLSGMMQTSWLATRVPWDRHGGKTYRSVTDANTPGVDGFYSHARDGKINVGFCDGHAETILQSNAKRVRISPYELR